MSNVMGYDTLSLTAWPRHYDDRERAGLRRLLHALPADQRAARYADVAKCWARLRAERIRLVEYHAGLGASWWPLDTVAGGPAAHYQPGALE